MVPSGVFRVFVETVTADFVEEVTDVVEHIQNVFLVKFNNGQSGLPVLVTVLWIIDAVGEFLF